MLNRFRKRKEPSLLEELKELELLEEGETVDIPDLEIEDLIEENALSVIVRCLNPHAHKVGGLVKAIPPIWGLEDRVRGRGVGDNRVQFIFTSEADMQHVLTKGPWFVNGWMVSMDQWSPSPPMEFLKRIPFWIRVRGLPIHTLKKEVVEVLLGPLGKVESVELHAKNSNSLEYIRALVHIDTEEPLQFRRTARFRSGLTIPTELEYEKLIKVCYSCKRLTHDQSRCPFQIATEQAEGRDIHERRKVNDLRRQLSEKETRAKEVIKKQSSRQPAKGTVTSRGRATPDTLKGKSISQADSREEKRRGKRVASTPQLVWSKKGEQGSTKRSRSTEESTANQRSSGEWCGQKSVTVSPEIRDKTEGLMEPGSVFSRLGSNEKEQGSAGSRGRGGPRRVEGDLRVKLNGGTSEDKRDGQSSKGSRSPPSVFERLSGQLPSSPKVIRSSEGSQYSDAWETSTRTP
ncbi:hypothetical protein Bca101_023645 [Brassica carinata]